MNILTRCILPAALLSMTLACEPADSSPAPAPAATLDQVQPLAVAFDFVDGADFPRSVRFLDAALLEDGLRLRYRALVDGQARTIDYAQYGSDAPMEVSVTGPDTRASIALVIDDGRADFYIADVAVGAFEWTEKGTELSSDRQSDALSFALLSLFPHQVEGLDPAGLFEYERQTETADGYGTLEQGKVTLGGIIGSIGGLFKARIKCTKINTYTCSAQCAQTADGCACGGQCGAIACCSSGCTVREEVTYSGGVGAG
jgi:hypothetical protein